MNRFLLIPLLLVVGVWVVSCGTPSVPEGTMDPLKAKEFLRRPSQPLLIDVRTSEEYGQERIAGAKLLPLQELESRLAEIPKDKPLLLYCHSGKRSQKAADLLASHGFKDIHQITGGIEAWKGAGLPVESPSTPVAK